MPNLCVIVDIDTTIANNDHRAAYLDKECVRCLAKIDTHHRARCKICGGYDARISQESWDKFLDPEIMMHDTPVPEAQKVIEYFRTHDIPFHYLTGRNESMRAVTEAWLTEHFDLRPHQEVVMRPVNLGKVPASKYKEQAFLDLKARQNLEGYTFFFMEDDPFVFSMYQKYGLVLRCPEAWKHFLPEDGLGNESDFRQ